MLVSDRSLVNHEARIIGRLPNWTRQKMNFVTTIKFLDEVIKDHQWAQLDTINIISASMHHFLRCLNRRSLLWITIRGLYSRPFCWEHWEHWERIHNELGWIWQNSCRTRGRLHIEGITCQVITLYDCPSLVCHKCRKYHILIWAFFFAEFRFVCRRSMCKLMTGLDYLSRLHI